MARDNIRVQSKNTISSYLESRIGIQPTFYFNVIILNIKYYFASGFLIFVKLNLEHHVLRAKSYQVNYLSNIK